MLTLRYQVNYVSNTILLPSYKVVFHSILPFFLLDCESRLRDQRFAWHPSLLYHQSYQSIDLTINLVKKQFYLQKRSQKYFEAVLIWYGLNISRSYHLENQFACYAFSLFPLFENLAFKILVCYDSEQPDFHPIATLLKFLNWVLALHLLHLLLPTNVQKCIFLAASQKVKIVKNSSPILMRYKTLQFSASYFESEYCSNYLNIVQTIWHTNTEQTLSAPIAAQSLRNHPCLKQDIFKTYSNGWRCFYTSIFILCSSNRFLAALAALYPPWSLTHWLTDSLTVLNSASEFWPNHTKPTWTTNATYFPDPPEHLTYPPTWLTNPSVLPTYLICSTAHITSQIG